MLQMCNLLLSAFQVETGTTTLRVYFVEMNVFIPEEAVHKQQNFGDT